MKKIYFICTGNSCRSQMAEGFAKKYLPDWEVRSAGVEVHGLNPKAVEVMAEKGIDISHNTSDLIDPEYFNKCDFVVTLCGDARDRCPRVPSGVTHLHWGLNDPAKASGSDVDILNVFREVRDKLEHKVDCFSKNTHNIGN
ncbi:arsenate reductase (thioredoxin) [Companilactobacillus allii]|uniref:Arsenate reductase (Thioredoxin) n=1 Tax=Companilactobacillus allii TaxID=1847728 RepID=A0A1P8Q237_9LACO|nr:arsenate reductase (thioredoxin) [Companilactobacillus allii]APX71849.1 arsenate reductase (thioredoxin) [Companilactobacillus allii]USQ68936.1 arsenate reductase (thioredoxin) [Companilactobacillus allii]